MTRKSKIIVAVCSLIVLFLVARLVLNRLRHEEHQTISLNHDVGRVELRGTGVPLHLATGEVATHDIKLETSDRFGCSLHARANQNGKTVAIEIIKGDFRPFWCDPDVRITLPQTMNIDIGLEQLAADISGNYSDIHIRSRHAVINFDSSATHFAMQGHDAAVRLNFTSFIPRDAVQLDVDHLAQSVNFSSDKKEFN